MRLELTKRGDYAVRAMLALARGTDGAADAERPAVRATDRRCDGHPGPLPAPGPGRPPAREPRRGDAGALSGGYRLTRAAAEISLLEVIEAVEGDTRRRTCVLRGGPCGVDGTCDVHEVFAEGQEALRSTFARAALAELAGPATTAALDATGG